MRKRFLNQTAITGYASIVFAVAPLFQEGTKMNMPSWVLLGVGAILAVVGIFRKPNQCLTLSGLTALVENRKVYLVPLKENIKNRLSRANDLVKNASEYPLEEYGKKYVKKNMPTIGIYSWVFVKLRFMKDNLYYESLKETDSLHRPLVQKYNFLYSQIKDRKLKKLLNGLWSMEHSYNSTNVFTLLSKNNTIVNKRLTTSNLRTARIGEKFGVAAFNMQLDSVMERIAQLLDGQDDE